MRRVVTGVDANGVAVFTRDDESPHVLATGGFEMGELWLDRSAVISDGREDPVVDQLGAVPAAGQVQMRYVVFPPQQVMDNLLEQELGPDNVSADFKLDGDDPHRHTTETVDYGFVLEGELDLELDNGVRKRLRQGDAYIQNGTRHAWRNPTQQRAVIAVVMLGARRA